MGGDELASFVDVRSDGVAFGADFDELIVEIFGFGGAVDIDESFEVALVVDEIANEGGFGFGEVVLVFD